MDGEKKMTTGAAPRLKAEASAEGKSQRIQYGAALYGGIFSHGTDPVFSQMHSSEVNAVAVHTRREVNIKAKEHDLIRRRIAVRVSVAIDIYIIMKEDGPPPPGSPRAVSAHSYHKIVYETFSCMIRRGFRQELFGTSLKHSFQAAHTKGVI